MENDRFDRQKLFFGEDGQKKIEAQKVGVVGLGGIGSQITQGLAYLGIRRFVLVDEDIVEQTNLNRLVGATEDDVLHAAPKVRVAERTINGINPNAVVEIYQSTNRSKKAIDALRKCTFLFGCVDNDGARLVLSELAAAYSIALIDSATEIIPENGKIIAFGGRVVIAQTGKYCLSCAGQIDMAVAKQDLEDTASRDVRRAHGYGLGEQVKAPAVVSLNGVIANLALTEFLMMVTGLREPNIYLHYRGERGIVLIREVKQDPDCIVCHYIAGKKDKANLYRYIG